MGEEDDGSAMSGTCIKFAPRTQLDKLLKLTITVHLQCITCMEEYQDMSMEELRFQDYARLQKPRLPFGSFTVKPGPKLGTLIIRPAPVLGSVSPTLPANSMIGTYTLRSEPTSGLHTIQPVDTPVDETSPASGTYTIEHGPTPGTYIFKAAPESPSPSMQQWLKNSPPTKVDLESSATVVLSGTNSLVAGVKKLSLVPETSVADDTNECQTSAKNDAFPKTINKSSELLGHTKHGKHLSYASNKIKRISVLQPWNPQPPKIRPLVSYNCTPHLPWPPVCPTPWPPGLIPAPWPPGLLPAPWPNSLPSTLPHHLPSPRYNHNSSPNGQCGPN